MNLLPMNLHPLNLHPLNLRPLNLMYKTPRIKGSIISDVFFKDFTITWTSGHFRTLICPPCFDCLCCNVSRSSRITSPFRPCDIVLTSYFYLSPDFHGHLKLTLASGFREVMECLCFVQAPPCQHTTNSHKHPLGIPNVGWLFCVQICALPSPRRRVPKSDSRSPLS